MNLTRIRRLLAAFGCLLSITLAACVSTDRDAGSDPSVNAGQQAPEIPIEPSATWKLIDGVPDPERLRDLRDELNVAQVGGGTVTLDACPLGEPLDLLTGLPPAWARNSLKTHVDGYGLLGGERKLTCHAGNARVEFGELGSAITLDGPEVLFELLNDAVSFTRVASATEPAPLLGGEGFTFCYDVPLEGDDPPRPACAAAWVHEDLYLIGTVLGEGAATQIAADWLSSILPMIVSGGALEDITEFGQEYTIRYQDEDGFRLRLELLLRPIVKGSDSDLLQSEWRLMGGRDTSIPCSDSGTQTTGYAFGSIEVFNETDGFDPPAVSWRFHTGSRGVQRMGIGFGNSPLCQELFSGATLSPKMESDYWGPVPVVFVYPDVFTPAQPEGDAERVSAFPLFVQAPGAEILDSEGSPIPSIPVVLTSP